MAWMRTILGWMGVEDQQPEAEAPTVSDSLVQDKDEFQDLLQSIRKHSTAPIQSGWYQTRNGVWVRLSCFYVYMGMGRVLWAVMILDRGGHGIGQIAAAIVQKQIENGELVRRSEEEVFASHTPDPEPGHTGCGVCGSAKNFWTTFPCRGKKSK